MGYDIKIDTPLDWMGVTDHSEYVGTVALANTPGSDISKLPIAKELIVHDAADIQRIYLFLGDTMIDPEANPGAGFAGGGRFGLEAEQRHGRQGQRAGQVHGVLLL